MKIQQLRYFQAAYKYENMSMASRELHISQPSISMAIKELESEFNTVLFSRSGKKLLPTKEGDLFFVLSTSLTNQVEMIKKTMVESCHPANSIHLGLTPMIDEFFFTPILKSFLQKYPDMHISLSEQGSEQLEESIKNDELDCALITHTAEIPKGLQSISLASTETVFCAHKDNSRISGSHIGSEQITAGPLILFKSGFLITQQIHSRIKEAGVSLQALNIYYSDQLSTVRNFISHDIAAGFLYRPIAETMPEVKSGSLSPPLITRISLVWKSGYENYPHIKLFINYILNNISLQGFSEASTE